MSHSVSDQWRRTPRVTKGYNQMFLPQRAILSDLISLIDSPELVASWFTINILPAEGFWKIFKFSIFFSFGDIHKFWATTWWFTFYGGKVFWKIFWTIIQMFSFFSFGDIYKFSATTWWVSGTQGTRAHIVQGRQKLGKVGKGNEILEVWQKIKMHERGNKMFNFQPKRKELQNLSSIEIVLLFCGNIETC